MMRGILPAWTEPDPELYRRLGDMIDPGRKVLAALERIVPLSGKRIADVGTGIGHYPMLLAHRTARTYGIESDPALLGEARSRATASHQPNIRMVEGESTALPLRDAAVDIVLHGLIDAGGQLVVIGYYGRDDVAPLLEPEVVAHARQATQRRIGWWLRHDFKIKVVHAHLDLRDEEAAHAILPRLYGDRARAFLMSSHPSMPKLKLGLYHLAKTSV
jgi:SAM-dependent methyltransferase